MKYTVLAATLAASVAATPSHHHHHHAHRHAKKHAAAKVEKRAPDVVTEVVVGATATVFELDGKIVDAATAKAGLAEGEYIIVGETTPTFVPPPPPPPATSSAAPLRAQFVEEPISSPAAPTTTSAPPPPPTTTAQPTTSSAPPPPKTSKPAQSSPSSGATGLDADFPSGKISCDTFPHEYGAVALDWLGTGGWSGLQFVPGYSSDSQSISDIITGIVGQTCSKGAMCSYACPPGYQKTQWPKAQGATLQSVGGLYCNEDGFLELTRPDHPKLCEAGAGGVTIKNDLDDSVCTCRTDYPGIESMVIPACTTAGEIIELTNPDETDYYVWDGKTTSAQYYVNKKGYAVEDACVWNSPLDPKGAGNWSPVNIGTGKTADGTTWLSIFQNLPTSNAKLDFNIEITGDVSSKCSYINGVWTGGDNGCTTSMPSGGKAVIRYF
ncbi:SUN domain-containing protein [Trichoderma gracile]